MIGFGILSGRRAESVESPLKVRAVALDDGNVRLLLVSCDLLGLSLGGRRSRADPELHPLQRRGRRGT